MIDQRLEARLRLDPDNDPRHQVGLVWRRVAALPAAPAWRARPRFGARSSVAQLLAAVLVLLAILALAIGVGTKQHSTPSTSPASTSTLGPTVPSASRVQAALEQWQASLARTPPVSLTTWTRTGGGRFFGAGTFASSTPYRELARVGELSRLFVDVAVVHASICALPAPAMECQSSTPDVLFLNVAVAAALPDWPQSDPTTIDQLLHGTSGLAPVGESLEALNAAIATEPTVDWSRDAALARALAAPRRFSPGAQRAPVDTEAMVLEDILATYTGRSFFEMYPPYAALTGGDMLAAEETETQHGPFLPGHLANGEPIDDLDPPLVAALGDAGGQAASSQALAAVAMTLYDAVFDWGPSTVQYLTDADNGRQNPPGAIGYCPCISNTRQVIAATGHAIGWSVLLAYDFRDGVAIGVAVGSDVSDEQLGALRDSLVAALA